MSIALDKQTIKVFNKSTQSQEDYPAIVIFYQNKPLQFC